ncbi:MAG: hypothetical protein GW762_02625 [Candidatus Pacebacteria bacterium]|nr:hypothetical protein [Candidatus Paceibacterota bacterium]PIR63744.1 MAG: hypothetical protein COU64_02100 [Candidatus Pacebacteria bacterium CG10_big_fil_rev_8_21_14_0_10_40_26]PIZ78530.1 MAG: hypothetical protein COY01_04785 [Candidatus Pacebacteria bacterium CG_4_10_14_0_2_um_filter_40_20]PJA69381.1 MAG: hypothetical protein CO156_00675 [Candidatus Pacebacteria bacterium CG_4_9_14_3_um_filter_40_12]PJC41398.1 MAG: hypothetical protein CO041_04660 [Candidatus Pacebacteria bacterium CG_4_9_
METFLYPLLFLLAGIAIVFSSASDIITGKDEEQHITNSGTNLSVVGIWVGICLAIIGFFWGIIWLLFYL